MNEFDVAAIAIGEALAKMFNIPFQNVNFNKKLNVPPQKGYGFSSFGLMDLVNKQISAKTVELAGKSVSMNLIEATKYVSKDVHDLVVFVKNKLSEAAAFFKLVVASTVKFMPPSLAAHPLAADSN